MLCDFIRGFFILLFFAGNSCCCSGCCIFRAVARVRAVSFGFDGSAHHVHIRVEEAQQPSL